MPIAGGAMWALFGSQLPFLVGAGIVLISLILTQFMRVLEQPVPVAVAAGD